MWKKPSESVMVLVKVTEGTLDGETVTSEIEGTYHSFKGIPYATPPVGDLRFKAPLPPQSWEGIRNAKELGNQCHQFNFITKTRETGSEDCLYLNVYTPDVKPTKPLPVMIWIHGGAFCCGNGNDDIYGPDFLIRHGVILVTFNYRLEVLGFLCLDTADVPGNAGAKDQVAAMRWVKKNISNFGGDPENITLFGQSAGAVCATYHCVSPMTKGLFKRVIAESGAMPSWWPFSYRPRQRAIDLAKKLGCKSDDDKELYEFFKNQPPFNLVEVQSPLTFTENQKCQYEPQNLITSEKVFPNVETYFTGNIQDALKHNIHDDIELIIGYNEDDGVVALSVILDMEGSIKQANTFKQYFVPKSIELFCSPDEQLEVGGIFKKFYSPHKNITVEDLSPITNFYNGHYYKYGSLQFAKYFAVKNKVYFYKFSCKSERNVFGKIMGVTPYFKNKELVSHIDEIAYLFPMKKLNLKINTASNTFKMINNVTKLWTNFAKTGIPTPDASLGVNWRPFRAQSQYFMDIGNKLSRGFTPDKDENLLWEAVMTKYLPSNVYQSEDGAA